MLDINQDTLIADRNPTFMAPPVDGALNDSVEILRREHSAEDKIHIEKLISFLSTSAFRPDVKLKGSIEHIAQELATNLNLYIPDNMVKIREFLTNDIIQRVCDFCEDHKSNQAAINLEFLQQQIAALPTLQCQRYSMTIYTAESGNSQNDNIKNASDFFARQARQYNPSWVGTTTASQDLTAYLALGKKPHLLLEIGSIKSENMVSADLGNGPTATAENFDIFEIEMVRALSPNIAALAEIKNVISGLQKDIAATTNPIEKTALQSALRAVQDTVKQMALVQKMASVSGGNAPPAVKEYLQQSLSRLIQKIERTVQGMALAAPHINAMRTMPAFDKLTQALLPIIQKYGTPTQRERVQMIAQKIDRIALVVTLAETINMAQSALKQSNVSKEQKKELGRQIKDLQSEQKVILAGLHTPVKNMAAGKPQISALRDRVALTLAAMDKTVKAISIQTKAPLSAKITTAAVGQGAAVKNLSRLITQSQSQFIKTQSGLTKIPAVTIKNAINMRVQIQSQIDAFSKDKKTMPSAKQDPLQVTKITQALKSADMALSTPALLREGAPMRLAIAAQTIANIIPALPTTMAEKLSVSATAQPPVTASVVINNLQNIPQEIEKIGTAIPTIAMERKSEGLAVTIKDAVAETTNSTAAEIIANLKIEASDLAVKNENKVELKQDAKTDTNNGCTGTAACPHCTPEFSKSSKADAAQYGIEKSSLSENINVTSDGGLLVIQKDGATVAYSAAQIEQSAQEMSEAIVRLQDSGIVAPNTSESDHAAIMEILNGTASQISNHDNKNDVHICDANCHHNQNLNVVQARAEDAHYVADMDWNNIDSIDFDQTNDLMADFNEASLSDFDTPEEKVGLDAANNNAKTKPKAFNAA